MEQESLLLASFCPLREVLVAQAGASCSEQLNQGHLNTFEFQQNTAGLRATATGGQSTVVHPVVRAQSVNSNRVVTYQQKGTAVATTFSQTDPNFKRTMNELQTHFWISSLLGDVDKPRVSTVCNDKATCANVASHARSDQAGAPNVASHAWDDQAGAPNVASYAWDDQADATSLMSHTTDSSEDLDDVNPGCGGPFWGALLCPFRAIFQILECCWTGLVGCFYAVADVMQDYLPISWSVALLPKGLREEVKEHLMARKEEPDHYLTSSSVEFFNLGKPKPG
jgi:hypothetical protein